MKEIVVENNETSQKDIIPDAAELRRKIKLKTRLRLSDYIFRDVDCKTDKKKKAAEERMGSHRLSELHHFKSYHK